MKRIKFEHPAGSPTTTLNFTQGLEIKAPTFGASIGTPDKRTFDGTLYIYEKGVAKETIPLTIDLMSETERDNLIDFILNITDGGFSVFRYTDQDEDIHDVRFMNNEYDFGDGTFPYSVQLELLEI